MIKINNFAKMYFLINIYISPIHRVLVPMNNHRHSFVYFAYPKFDAEMPFASSINNNKNNINNDNNNNFKDSGEASNDQIQYNTLLQIDNESDYNDRKYFGEYILNKWKGVHL